MKTLASLLGIVAMAGFISACGPDMKVINDATAKAQADVTKAEASAKGAEDSAAVADAAAKKAEDAAAGAEDAVRKANDSVARLEAAFATSVTK
jgi:formyltetrahydrofolate synthetase